MFDVNSVARLGKSSEFNASLMLEDAAVDAWCDYCVGSSPDPSTFLVLPIWQIALFKAFPESPPLAKKQLPKSVKTVLLPTIARPDHWALLTLNVEDNSAVLLDPFFEDQPEEVMQNLKNVLCGFRMIYGLEQGDKEISLHSNCLFQQHLTNNCGAHTCLFVEQITKGLAIRPYPDMNMVRLCIRDTILRHVGSTQQLEEADVKQPTPAPKLQVDTNTRKRKLSKASDLTPRENLKKIKAQKEKKAAPWWRSWFSSWL
jgi:Ulp1 protease family, C-terminal catalytic domain